MNRYIQCLQEAEQAKQIKRDNYNARLKVIWSSVFAYLPDEDIYYPKNNPSDENEKQVIRPLHQIKRRAYYAMQSHVYVNSARITEFEALYNLFEQALLKKEWQKLTRTQRETVTLVELSKDTGMRESKFISNVLSITQNAANRRLRTLAEKNAQFTPQFAIIQIKDALEATPRYCPFCAEQGNITRLPNPKNAMCWAHHDRFVRRQDFGRYPPDEFERVVYQSSAEYWQQVRNELDNAA